MFNINVYIFLANSSSKTMCRLDTHIYSIFSNLTEDPYEAPRAAWLSGMIVLKHHMLQAKKSTFNKLDVFVRKHTLDFKVSNRTSWLLLLFVSVLSFQARYKFTPTPAILYHK